MVREGEDAMKLTRPAARTTTPAHLTAVLSPLGAFAAGRRARAQELSLFDGKAVASITYDPHTAASSLASGRRNADGARRVVGRRLLTIATALLTAVLSAVGTPADYGELAVGPGGDDTYPGTTARPLRTLQRALDLAKPGTVITLAPGVYEPAATRRAGRPDAPIVIRGGETGRDPARRFTTVIRGSRIVLQINHSHVQVRGLTVDGQPGISHERFPDEPGAARAFKDDVQGVVANSKLIYVGYAPDARDITGVVLDDLYLHGAGGECVRLRNNAHGNVVSSSVIRWCGLVPSGDDVKRYRYHNGEGVYIGTSPKSITQPMFANDESHDNVVRDSEIGTFGSECFEVKENAHHNRMERVTCRANEEPLAFGGSNVELRGHHNTVQDSVLAGSRGVNLKIASDAPGYDEGGNAVVGNRFLDASGPHIQLKSTRPMGLVCGNVFATARITDEGAALSRAAEPCPR
jgi:hypothetical protein